MLLESCAILALSVIIADSPDTKGDKAIPAVLRAAFLQRESFDTARFTYRMERAEPGRAPVVRNWDYQVASNGVCATDRGDDDGVMLRKVRDGQPILGWAGAANSAERTWEFKSNESWLHRAGSRHFVVGSHATWMGYEDIRTHGLRAIEAQYKTPRQHLKLLKGLKDWKTNESNPGRVTVTARGEEHKDGTLYEYEWEIDVNKGPAIVGARQRLLERSGRCTYESKVTLDLIQIDNVWWPQRVELTSSSGKRVLMEFSNLEFNRPHHAKSISPDLLNIPVGARVIRASDARGRFVYAGKGKVIDEATWQKQKNQHDIAALEQFHADVRAVGLGRFPAWWDARDSDFGIANVADDPDLWEVYVRRWSTVKSAEGEAKGIGPLKDEQRTAAQGILDDCRKQATPIRSRIDKEAARVHAELADVGNQIQKATDDTRSALVQRAADLTRQTEELKKAPEIERIFDSLKKRLDGLLTKEQLAPYAPVKPTPPPPGPVPMTPPSR